MDLILKQTLGLIYGSRGSEGELEGGILLFVKCQL